MQGQFNAYYLLALLLYAVFFLKKLMHSNKQYFLNNLS